MCTNENKGGNYSFQEKQKSVVDNKLGSAVDNIDEVIRL